MSELEQAKATVKDWLNRANPKQVGNMLLAIYERQTQDEQASETTHLLNNMGFNGRDAKFGTRVAQSYQKYGNLTEKQTAAVRKMLRKYWKQLWIVAKTKKAA